MPPTAGAYIAYYDSDYSSYPTVVAVCSSELQGLRYAHAHSTSDRIIKVAQVAFGQTITGAATPLDNTAKPRAPRKTKPKEQPAQEPQPEPTTAAPATTPAEAKRTSKPKAKTDNTLAPATELLKDEALAG